IDLRRIKSKANRIQEVAVNLSLLRDRSRLDPFPLTDLKGYK
ncbi:unnamed protein product, partial [marine sediment metagenome]